MRYGVAGAAVAAHQRFVVSRGVKVPSSRFWKFFQCLLLTTLILHTPRLRAQDTDSLRTNAFNFDIDFSRVSYLLGDVMVVGNYCRSFVGMSRDYQDLTAAHGYGISFESYTPLMPKAFLNYGVGYTNKGFTHTPPPLGQAIDYRLHYVEVPFYLSYELPELRDLDLRFCIGGQLSYLAHATSTGSLDELRAMEYSRHIFEPDGFTRLDLALLFGLSIERGRFFSRARGVVGSAMVSPPNTGQMTAFYLDLGYFPFRRSQRKS